MGSVFETLLATGVPDPIQDSLARSIEITEQCHNLLPKQRWALLDGVVVDENKSPVDLDILLPFLISLHNILPDLVKVLSILRDDIFPGVQGQKYVISELTARLGRIDVKES